MPRPPLTLLLLKFVPDHLPDTSLLPPLFLLCSPCMLLVEGPVLLRCLPGREPVQRGDTGHIVVLPRSKLFLCWSIRKEPASPDAPACPETVLRVASELFVNIQSMAHNLKLKYFLIWGFHLLSQDPPVPADLGRIAEVTRGEI